MVKGLWFFTIVAITDEWCETSGNYCLRPSESDCGRFRRAFHSVATGGLYWLYWLYGLRLVAAVVADNIYNRGCGRLVYHSSPHATQRCSYHRTYARLRAWPPSVRAAACLVASVVCRSVVASLSIVPFRDKIICSFHRGPCSVPSQTCENCNCISAHSVVTFCVTRGWTMLRFTAFPAPRL